MPAEEIGLRRPHAGESTRSKIPLDWNQDGQISLVPIDIGWWGHCHNEAPANAMGLDPKKGVSLYRADRGVAADAALVRYSEEDCWDAIGAFTADHEGSRIRDPRTGQVSSPGYVNYSSGGSYDPTRVDETDFVGNRNNGGHYLQLSPDRPGGRRYAQLLGGTALDGAPASAIAPWPVVEIAGEPLMDGRGRLLVPLWVPAPKGASGELRLLAFDSRGQRTEQHLDVNLDPSQDGFVKLAEEIERVDPAGGGRLVEFYYNPATQEMKEQPVQLSAADGFARQPGAPRVSKVAEAIAVQETTYDSVAEIDEFVVADLGLPFTFDTSSGQAVWNYPVSHIRRDVEGRTVRNEEGHAYTYTTYRLRYRTMGGPEGDTRYIIKRDAMGRMVRALALRPMPDFAYRNERWVCAPATLDHRGRPAINLRALTAGYLSGPDGRAIVPDLWRHQAALVYASISDQTPATGAWLFETQDGALISFPDAARFDAAVAADRALRAAAG